jgi:hypothetical protein
MRVTPHSLPLKLMLSLSLKTGKRQRSRRLAMLATTAAAVLRV